MASSGSSGLTFPWLSRPGPRPEAIRSGQRAQMAEALRPIPEKLHALLPLLTDTHCHMAGYSIKSRQQFCQSLRSDGPPRSNGARHYVVVSVAQEDWETAGQIDAEQFRAAFGVHPQCASGVEPAEVQVDEGSAHGRHNSEFLAELRRWLSRNPRAIVGEIGLDRNRSHRFFFDEHQVPLFVAQLRVAAELRRPISVHSVQADGELVRLLAEEAKAFRPMPPKICLHSFAGSLETLQAIITAVERRCPEDAPVRVFVGLNAWTNLFKKQATAFVRALAGRADAPPGSKVKGVRRGRARMLLESDWNPADFDFRGSQQQDVDKILVNGVIRLAELLEEPPEDVAATLARNTDDFMDGWVRDAAEQQASSGSDSDGARSEEDADEAEEEDGGSRVGSRRSVEASAPEELTAALRRRGLTTRGSSDERRQRLRDHDSFLTMAPSFKDVLQQLDQRL